MDFQQRGNGLIADGLVPAAKKVLKKTSLFFCLSKRQIDTGNFESIRKARVAINVLNGTSAERMRDPPAYKV